ncbi:acylphosphatase-2-like isoform X2 [Osmerus eperlanus]|uniref:acylphosphatase-2-like isoform X2 n=1 Tax=Osmerus eperlanus TaxID=29151 RepID=UPI002E15CCC1
MSNDTDGDKLCSVDFEISGHVQGVCFRMYTEKEGLRLGLCGWVKNTNKGTVIGQIQGPADMVREMSYLVSSSEWEEGTAFSSRSRSTLYAKSRHKG